MREQQKGLYSPAFEHDNCGIGAVVNSRGIKSHLTVERALHIVENLEHRAGKDAEGKTGDGVGILLQISHKFFSRVCKQADIQLGEEGEYGIAQLFFPQEELKRNQRKRCLRSSWRKKEWSFWDSVRFRSIRRFWDTKPGNACLISSRLSSKSRSRWRRDWILTGSFILQDGCSSRATTTPMWSPCPAGPLCTKACSW